MGIGRLVLERGMLDSKTVENGGRGMGGGEMGAIEGGGRRGDGSY